MAIALQFYSFLKSFTASRKILLSIFFVLFFLGCTQPKYVKSSEPQALSSGSSGNSQKDSNYCPFAFSELGVCLDYKWQSSPNKNEYNSFLFKVYRLNRADQSPIPVDDLDHFQVVLWMPSMGHGSSPVAIEKLDTGTYRVSQVYFIMGGDWEIQIRAQSIETNKSSNWSIVKIPIHLEE